MQLIHQLVVDKHLDHLPHIVEKVNQVVLEEGVVFQQQDFQILLELVLVTHRPLIHLKEIMEDNQYLIQMDLLILLFQEELVVEVLVLLVLLILIQIQLVELVELEQI